MKKLIAISVVFALVAGAAFAADIGAEVIGFTDVIKGSTAKDYYVDGSAKPSSVDAGGWPGGFKRGRVFASGEDDSGIFGAWFRFETYGVGNPGLHGNAWWKPSEMVKFRLGVNPDGDFGADGVARWGFYQVGGDVGVPKESWKFGASFYGGWGENGGLLTLTPTDGLEINLGVPYSQGGKAQYVYMSSTLQIAYTAEGLGKFALTYVGGKGNVEEGQESDGYAKPYTVKPDPDHKKFDDTTGTWVSDPITGGTKYEWIEGDKKTYIHDPQKIYLYAGLTMIENLSIDIGFGYTFPISGKGIKIERELPYEDKPVKFDIPEGKYSDPMAIGLAAHYNGGDFGVKARLQVLLAGQYKAEGGDAYKIPMNIVFDALPYYNISDTLTFLFSAGVDYTMKSSNDVDKDTDYAHMGFHVTPYITIKSSWWAPNFYAGIDIRTNGKKFNHDGDEKDGSTAMNWSVPIGIVFAF
jgi:hypothetical protein